MGTIASCDRPGSLTWMWRWCLLSTQPSCTHWTLQWLVKFTPTFLTGGWNGGAVEGWRCGEVPWRRSKGQSASASPWTVEEPTQHRHHVCRQVGGACMCSICPWIHCMWVLQWPMYCRSLPLPSPLKLWCCLCGWCGFDSATFQGLQITCCLLSWGILLAWSVTSGKG